MSKRPNVLWIMSDQHHADCVGYRNHPNVKTPNIDRIADRGVAFTKAYANNPICSPSRICYMSGQYVHTHQMYGNEHTEYPLPNSDLLSCLFRRYGYQTGLFGKSHMVRRWDEDGFEAIRYTDLCDAKQGDPATAHYFQYLLDRGLADYYEEGSIKPGQQGTMDGSMPAMLPYEHSIERYTGAETLHFLGNRDKNRPFFIQMSFQRPHPPTSPAKEHFNMYDPEEIVLPDSASDYFEHRFAGKPQFMQDRLKNGCGYPLADPNPMRLKRCLASYYALISVIDNEIGHVLTKLEEDGELDHTIVVYCADHGDFAGDHGLAHKNFGIYESIHRIPFIISWPGGPQGEVCESIVESIDLYPTLCELCEIPLPSNREGVSMVSAALGQPVGKEAAYCEWDWLGQKISAIRTERYRLVYYGKLKEGELYDHRTDPGEIHNLWKNPHHAQPKTELLELLLSFTLQFATVTDSKTDREINVDFRYSPTKLVHKHTRYWSSLKQEYEKKVSWPPAADDVEK